MIRLRSLLVASLILAIPNLAQALDTTEQFDSGLSAFEVYMSGTGLGRSAAETGLRLETQLGIGLTDYLSGYLGLAGEGNAYFADGAMLANFGIFATPLDSVVTRY